MTSRRTLTAVEPSEGGRTLEASIAALAYRGRVSWVGRAGRDPTPPEVWPLMERNASLTGVFLGAEIGHHPARVRAVIERLLERVANGELRVVIDRVFPLADASSAHAYIESRQAFGRVLLTPVGVKATRHCGVPRTSNAPPPQGIGEKAGDSGCAHTCQPCRR